MLEIPKEVQSILKKLEKNNYEAYVVGGCVRDLLLNKKPKDWDVCTNARPEEIQKIFPESFYTNKFGTVTVKTQKSKLKSQNRQSKIKNLKSAEVSEVEVTTYRFDEKYSDKRHPDEVKFTDSLEKDLTRRDFTINTLALNIKGELIDLFGGEKDLAKKIIRTVGLPANRFNEDALRMMRAIRLAIELDFKIEPATLKAIQVNNGWLRAIAKERIQDELVKIIMTPRATDGILLLQKAELLKYIIPELEKGVGVSQNRHHIYTIFEHSIYSLKFAAQRNYSLTIRLAALLHDIAKPQTKQGEWPEATFYNHDQLGAKFSSRILTRLKFPRKIVDAVANLVRNHMFVYDVDKVTEAGVRRLLRRVGPENIQDLLYLRVTDRLGSGCPKAVPYKLRHLQYLVEKVSRDPISVLMLKINGDELMKILKIKPGPRVGLLLSALLGEVLEDPKLNVKKYLTQRLKELNKFSDSELKKAIKKVEEKKQVVEIEGKKKYYL